MCRLKMCCFFPVFFSCVSQSLQLFCLWRSTERLTALMPVWFQLKHSHQQPYSLLRLHPDLPITIHHCFYLPFARDGGKTGERVQKRKRESAVILIGFCVYWNQILIFFLFFKWEKVHCPTKGDFYRDLGKEELKWASGALLSPVDCVQACGNWIEQTGSFSDMCSLKSFNPVSVSL